MQTTPDLVQADESETKFTAPSRILRNSNWAAGHWIILYALFSQNVHSE
jgi:hypothetical protein